ncbi:uncharacterized protein LOC112576833 [Pomacea canaliculata]|uniref:uncharacterized protein LOC112576833 n=1 Tax=Pomacea canaliculata TaxID=400727 RepID=UPI000D73AFB4|nr:uncharacterized protein LOC112576833 [Pomacea canaliculata]
MSGQTNPLTSPPQETSSSHTKTLETRRGADTPPRTQTEGCDDEDDCGSSNNYDNNVGNDVNTANRDTASTSEHARSCEVSDVHKDYIENNRHIIENKCKMLYTCTRELYKTETLSRILEGGDIQLHNICGVLTQYKDDQNATETNRCGPEARKFLKRELEEELKIKIEKYNDDYGPDDDDEPTWQNLANCLNNTADLDKLCRFQKEQSQCLSVDIESKTEKLLNTRLRTMHCYCEGLSPARSLPLVPLVAGVCGGALVLLVIFIIFLLLRRRKLRGELYKHDDSQHVNL